MLFRAPLGSTLPTNTVVGSVFTDTWPVAWVPLGSTDGGITLNYETKADPINVEDYYDPITYRTTSRDGSVELNLASYTATNWSYALNGAAVTVTGSGATTLSKVEPGAVGTEIRCMIGYESLDATYRFVAYQVFNASQIKAEFKKAPAFATIPYQFNFELPSSGIPFSQWFAGTSRG
jgi:hypothetical protein